MKLEKIFGERAYVRNLFALLSVLAVSGHFIEQCLSGSWAAKGLYIFIFSFHMPLLIFLIGAIFKDHEDDGGAIRKLIFFFLGLYVLMKAVISIAGLLLDGEWSFSLLSESGAPWIFFSAAIYLLLAYCLKRVDKRALLGLSVILALLCGYTEAIGDFLVLSRTIVFLPFFILGWMRGIDRTEQATDKKWLRLLGMITLALALFVTVRFARYGYLSRPFFDGRKAYATLGSRASFGPLCRMLAYGISAAMGVSVLALTPRRSFGKFFDNIGARFVEVYFWHLPILYILTGLGAYDLLDQTFGRKLGRILWAACALACVAVLSVDVLRKTVFLGGRLLRNDAVRMGVFIFAGLGVLSAANAVLADRAGDSRTYQYYGDFYEEKRDTLDAVFIGPSSTYSALLPLLAWERYGIAISPFCCPNQPSVAAEYVIREARKTQPDALYIVPVGLSKPSDITLHYLVDNMPLSWNKIQLVKKMGEYLEIGWEEQLEFLFPIIRYHDRWTGLKESDFFEPLDGFHGSSYYSSFLSTSEDITSFFRSTERAAALSETERSALDSLLEYCAAEELNVLFVESAGLNRDEGALAKSNSIKDIIEAHGYPVLSFKPSVEEIGLNTKKDYYNSVHTNIHGAIKVTDYLSRYLIENYGFKDKRGDPAYSSWDAAYAAYTEEYASVYTLDVEWEGAPRDFSLSAPELTGVTVNGTELTVKWKRSPGADGYRVYRKLQAKGNMDEPGELGWEALDTVGADVLSYADPDREAGRTYFYTVIPYREKDGVYEWGDYNFSGVSGRATLEAPTLLSLEGTENNLTLTWEAVEGAAGYWVFRRIPTKTWFQIGTVVDGGTSYTDTEMLADMPYLYRTVAYYYEENGTTKTIGSYDADGLIWVPEREPAEMRVELKDGVPAFHWKRIEGISGYSVYRRTHDSGWEQLCTDLTNESTSFVDITARAGVDYSYKITPYIEYKDERYEYELSSAREWIRPTNAIRQPAMPVILSAVQTSNVVCVTWEPVSDASGYRVYRRTLLDDGAWGEWTQIISSTSDNVCLDKPGKTGEFEYLVRVLFTEDGVTYYGDFDGSSGYGVSFHLE